MENIPWKMNPESTNLFMATIIGNYDFTSK